MKDLIFDVRDFQRAARRMDALASQIPFALAGALNASAEIGRRVLIDDTWPGYVEARDPNFIKNALTTKGTRASKRNLRVVVYDKWGRAHLREHETGGTKKPLGSAIAVPVEDLAAKRTSRGMPSRLRPRALPNSFVTDGRRPNTHLKQGAVYQREGQYHAKGSVVTRTGKRRRNKDKTGFVSADSRTVKLRYVLKPTVPIRATVPFHADFNRAVKRAMPAQFHVAMRKAMATARKTK